MLLKWHAAFFMVSLFGCNSFALVPSGIRTSVVFRGSKRQAAGDDYGIGAWARANDKQKTESASFRAWAAGGDFGPGAWARSKDEEPKEVAPAATPRPTVASGGNDNSNVPGKRERVKAWIFSKVKPKTNSDSFRAWAAGGDYGPGAWARSKEAAPAAVVALSGGGSGRDYSIGAWARPNGNPTTAVAAAVAPAVAPVAQPAAASDGGESPGKRDRMKAWAKSKVKTSSDSISAWVKSNDQPSATKAEVPVVEPAPTPPQPAAAAGGGGSGRDYGIGAWTRV